MTLAVAEGARRTPYLALLAGSAISLVGNQLTAIAIPWLVLTTLGTPFDTGIIGVALTIPAVIGAIVGGVVVDRLGSRETSIVADLASGVTVALVPLAAITIGLTIPLLFVLAFAGALLDAPGATARQVLLPDVATRAGVPLERANATYQSIENVSFLIGPLLAGAIVLVAGATTALWIDAATFAVSAGLFLLLIQRSRPVRGPDVPADLGLGLRLVGRDRVLRALTLACIVANFVGMPLFVVILPAFALGLAGGAGSLGLLLAVFGGGLVAGSLAFGARGTTLSRRTVLAGGFLVTGLAFGVAALGLPFPVVLLALGVAGFATGPINPLAFTLMQERIAPEARGRAFGAILGGILLAAPLGMLVVGEITARWSPGVALAVAGLGFVAVGLAILVRGEFRELERA